MTRKIIACATVKGPNRSRIGQKQIGKVYRPGDEVPADLTDETRMAQLFAAGVLRYEGQEPAKPAPKAQVQLGTAKEDGPPLHLKAGDNDDNVDAQLNAIKADQARRAARGEKVGAELDAEMRAKDAAELDAEMRAQDEQRGDEIAELEDAKEVVGGAEMRALAAEEAEMLALDEQHEQLDAQSADVAQDEQLDDERRTVEVKAQTGEITDSGEPEEDGDEIRVSE